MSAREPKHRSAGTAVAIEIAIADPDLAERVQAMILREPGLRVLGRETGRKPDVRITDSLRAGADDVPVIVVSDEIDVPDVLLAGAAAILSEDTDGAALGAAIGAVLQGLTTLSAEFRRDLVTDHPGSVDSLAEDDEPEPIAIELTARELQVMQLLAEGASNKVIALRLGITPHTAKFHVASILAKLGASGRTDAVARAMRLGLIMI